MNKEKTGEEIKIEKSIEFYLYHSTQSIKLQRIILQKDITPDLEALKAMGVQWVEVENQFSSKEFFNEYEINILNDKDATIIPLSFDLSEIKEGPVAVVLGKNLEDQWVKAEIRAIEDRFEILEKPEIQLIKDRKDLAEIYAQEKDAAIRITTAALEQNITEQLEKDKETIGEEEKGIEEKSTEKAVETSETQTLPEEKVVVEENQKAEISDNATEKISPEEKPSLSRMKIKTSQMENPEVAITGALYELQNVETKESYKTNSSNEEGIAVVEVPYGEYKIDQIASGFAYEIAINIPEIQIKSETESILIENEIKTLNLEARPKEESPKDLVLSRSRDMASLSMMAMEPMMALAAIGPVTANGNGSIGGSLGNYSWSAVANGNTINWTFNVSKIARSVVNPDTSNYFDFSIPSYLTLVGTPAITGGILVNQGNGVYSGYSDNDRTARTTVVTFSTTINDPSRTSYEIEFRPSVRQSRYNAAVYYTFDFYQADTTSVIQSSIRTTSPATIGPLGLKIVPATLYYSPMQYGSLSIYKEDILGNSLTGAVFTLTGTSDYGDSITRTFDLRNLNNSTELNIPYGNYTLTETVTPVNYDPIPPQQVAINASTKSLTIVNHRSRGSLTVNKVDQDNLPLQGSTFVLTNGQLTFNFVMTNLSSQKITGIPYGTYTLTETVTPEGYQNTGTRTVTINQSDNSVTVQNTRNTGTLTINKTGNGGAPLEGAAFTLTGPNGIFPINKTDANGITSVQLIPYGSYTLEETIVPDGYLKMANQTVVIDSESKTLNLSNTIAPRGNLLIHKKGTGGVPLAGAGFTLRGNGQTYTSSLTDITGTASITNIPYGDYILEETTIPDGYAKSTNHNIKIDAATKEISLTNTAVIRGNLTIHKTGEGGFPLAGAGFTLEGNGKTYVSNLTDANGHTTITGIDYGTYTLRESTVPSGYSQVKDRIVTIDSPTKTEEMANHKPANLTESIILINEDVDNPNIKLAGGIFVITTEGYRFTVETDANGRAVLDNLPKGDYTVTQIKAANGYSVMPDNITFYLGNPQGVPAEVHAQNKKMPTSGNLPYIEIDVKNMNNQLPIAGTVIKLEGSDRSIRYLTTDANGKVLFDHLDYGVTYIGTIEDAPYMYKWPGTTPPQTPPMTVTTISPVGESTLFLAPVEISDLMIRLTEFDDIDIPIGNAKFLITDPDGGTHEVTTGADGTVTIPLYHGTYKVKQLTTDGNHLIDTQEYTIFIERQEELAIMNKLIRPELSTVDIKADKVWVDLPPSPKPDVHINLLGDGTKVRELTILANSANQTATFTALPKYDSNHYRIIYTIEEQAIPDYYAIYEMKDRRGLNWTIRNYEGKLIGDCIPGTFWVSSSTKAYEYFTNGATTGRNIPLNYTTGTAYQNSATYGYGIAQSRDGQYLYTVNRRGNLRIYNVSGTGTPVELTTTPIRLRTSAGGGLDNLNQYFHAAELSNDGTKLYVKSQEGAIIYQYNTATLLNNLGGGQVNATQQIASVTSAGDIVYLENGDLLVSGKSSNVSTGLWISRINPDGSYSSTAINVGTTNNSLNTVNTTGGVEGLGMVEGRLVMTSTTGTTPQQTALYYLDPLPTRNRPSSTVYTSTLFVNTSSTLSDYADMTSGSSSTCYGVVKVAGQKTWLNDRPENRPTSITVRLYKNGVPTDKTMVVDANTNWTYQFDDLDKYENNQRIQYTVREENTPPGYIVQYPNSTQEPNNYNITNRLEMGDVYVLKKNEKGSPLSGVRFALYKEDKSTLVGSPVYTNAQGKISFTKIPLGIYYLKEISTVTGYIPDPHFYKVEIRNSIGGTPETIVYNSNGAAQNNTLLLPFEITNHPYTADLIMEKRSLLGELLPGATFTLKKDGVVIQTKTSDSDGKLGFTHLLPGTYILNETVSPNGYNPNTKDYKIVVDNQGKFKVYIQTEFGEREIVSDPLVVYNQPEQTLGYFNLSKTRYNEGTGDAPTGINGVRFELRYSDENRIDKMGDLVGTGSGSTTTGIAITANTQPQGHDTLLNGIATYSHLADGYYYLKEVYRPDPPQGSQWSTEMVEHFIKVENKIAYIWENGTWKTAGTDGAVYYTTHSFDIYNSYRTNDQILKLIIKKADGDQTTQVLQAKFQLYVGNTEGSTLPYYDINGQPVMIHTSTTGNVEYPIPMVVGTYWLKEIEAPEGYEMIPRLIGPMAVTVKEGKYVLSLQQDTHTPPLWSVTGTSQEVSTLDLTVYNRRNYPLTLEKVDEAQNRILTGEAVFQVFKKSDYDNGIFEPIATLNTVEGIASSDALFKPGEYTIVEIASPEGYQPSPTAIEVRLKIVNGLPLWEHISGPAIPKNTLEVDIAIINKTHRHPLSILKYDEKDDMIISDSAEFAVYKGEDYSYDETKDEIIIQEGAIPITVMKTVEGLATSGADFVPGKYAIVETKSPKGYRGLSEPIELELKVIGEIASWEIIHGDPGTVSIHYTGGIIVKNNLLVYPSTGGIGSIIFLMGGLAIMGASLFIDRRRKSLIVNRK